MNILRRLQNLSEPGKRIVLWSVMIAVGLALFILWMKNVQEKLKNFQGGLKLPSLKEEIGEMPKIEMPEISEEELKKLEEELETATTDNSNESR